MPDENRTRVLSAQQPHRAGTAFSSSLRPLMDEQLGGAAGWGTSQLRLFWRQEQGLMMMLSAGSSCWGVYGHSCRDTLERAGCVMSSRKVRRGALRAPIVRLLCSLYSLRVLVLFQIPPPFRVHSCPYALRAAMCFWCSLMQLTAFSPVLVMPCQ